MNRQLSPLLLFGCTLLAACGGGSSTPPPPPTAISVSFSTAPPSSLNVSTTAPVAVTVSNDSSNSGVIFSCMPAGVCGTFTAITATSATYNAPASIPSGGSAAVVATSVKDSSKSATANVTINNPAAITVTLSTAPPGTLSTASSAVVAATTNDTAGVTWSCLPAGTCGSFNPTSTLTTATTTFTAPTAVPTGGSVTITATSVTDTTKSAQASITIVAGSSITVTISTAPPATLSTSGPNNTATIAATTNDAAGVTWSCAPAGTCGSFNPTSTLTTVTTTYTAPTAAPAGGTVTIKATSVTDTTKSAQAFVNISGTASLATLNGHYVFLVQSPTGNRGVATWIGSVALDGAGNVTGGIEELATKNVVGDVADQIQATGATGSLSGYTVDPSGHGRLTISTTLGEVLRMSFVLTSAAHAEVIEADGSPSQGNPGSGSLDLQTPASTGFAASQISGTYSFTMVGIDDTTSAHLSFGGSFTSDGNSNITGGSIDINSGTTSIETDSVGSSAFDSAPDANGRGTFHFAVSNPGQSRRFVYYILSPKALRLIEADGVADMGGSAYLQPTTSPTFSGNFVYQHSGWTSTTSRTVAAGQFSLASGSISAGICDSNPGGGLTPTTAAPVTGSYAAPTLTLTESAATSILKLYPVDSSINILDPNNSAGGGGALLLHTDSSINGTGILLPQQTPQPLTANYAVNLMNSIAATPTELDLVGILTGGTSGLADYDQKDSTLSNPMLGAALSASLAADTTHAGRYTGNLTVNPASTAISPYSFIPGVTPPTIFSFTVYQANGSQALGVETDNKANIIGRVVQQLLP